MDLNRILAASYEGSMALIEPKANGDWMYVLGCSAPCSVAEERMGHYKSCQSITIDLGERPLAVVALDVHYKDGKDTRTLQVAIKIERQDGHAYVDLQDRSSRMLKRVVHVVGPYEMRVRLPVGEPYNGEWLSTMTDADAEQWCRDGRGCRYVDPVTACRYLAEEIDEDELLEVAEGESQAEKLTRLEKKLAGTQAQLAQAQEWATTATRERDAYFDQLRQVVKKLLGKNATREWVKSAALERAPSQMSLASECEREIEEGREWRFVDGRRARAEEISPLLGVLWSVFDESYPVEHSSLDIDKLSRLLCEAVPRAVNALRALSTNAAAHKYWPHGKEIARTCQDALDFAAAIRRQ